MNDRKKENWVADNIAYLRGKLEPIEEYLPDRMQSDYLKCLYEIALDLAAQQFRVPTKKTKAS